MIRQPATLLASLIAMVVVACSGVSTTNPPPTPSASATLVPVDPVPPSPEPTDSPTPAPTLSPSPVPTVPPDPTPVPWMEIETEMVMLELRSTDLPIVDDGMGDGLSADGSEPRDISMDLDLRRAFAGWATLDPSAFEPGGPFDCADPHVLCGLQPNSLGGNDVVLVGLQTYGAIDLGQQRDGQLAIAFDRQGQSQNSPDGSGGFGASDLVLIADFNGGNMFELIYDGQYQARDTIGRVRIVGDTALFVMPLGRSEDPRYRVVTFERLPPQTVGAGRTDTLPGGQWNVDSFFDITYSIDSLIH